MAHGMHIAEMLDDDPFGGPQPSSLQAVAPTISRPKHESWRTYTTELYEFRSQVSMSAGPLKSGVHAKTFSFALMPPQLPAFTEIPSDVVLLVLQGVVPFTRIGLAHVPSGAPGGTTVRVKLPCSELNPSTMMK